jgi:hypothetical protein
MKSQSRVHDAYDDEDEVLQPHSAVTWEQTDEVKQQVDRSQAKSEKEISLDSERSSSVIHFCIIFNDFMNSIC